MKLNDDILILSMQILILYLICVYMKGVILRNIREKPERNFFLNSITSYLLNPLTFGLYGFALFFTILLGVKFILFVLDGQVDFYMDVDDVKMSLIGFISFYCVRIFQNILKGK